MDDIFSTDNNTVVSVTTHGVNVGPILEVVGHPNPKFNLTTGQSIAVLVKAERAVLNTTTGGGGDDPPSPAATCGVCGPAS